MKKNSFRVTILVLNVIFLTDKDEKRESERFGSRFFLHGIENIQYIIITERLFSVHCVQCPPKKYTKTIGVILHII